MTFITDRDAYVDSGWSYDDYADADSNFGGKDWFLVGKTFGVKESYFHFSFSNLPSNVIISKAQVSFYIYAADETMDTRACITDNNWEELEITWNNKPAHKTTITTFKVAARDHYIIDITDFVKDNEITTCLYAPNPPTYGDCQGATKEGALDDDDIPHVIIEYILSSSSSPSIITSLIVFFGIIGACFFGIIIFYTSKKSRQKREQQPYSTLPPEKQPFYNEKFTVDQTDWRYCPQCGNKVLKTEKFCRKCGFKQPNYG